MSSKLYILLEKTDEFKKDSVIWYGDDYKKAQQQYRYWAKSNYSRRGAMVIKEINLDDIPDYKSQNATDDQAMLLDKYVSKQLNRYVKTRCLAKNGQVTYSISFKTSKEDDSEGRMSATHPGIMASNDDHYTLGAEAKVFDIIIDMLMKEIEILVPVTLKINGKTHNKYEPQI